MKIVNESEDIAKWLHSKIDRLPIPSDERYRVAGGCFDTVLEHQIAISILFKNRLYGSAFALARSVFEAYVRGLWLAYCASNQQITDFLNDKFPFTFQKLIDDVEKLEAYSNGIISKSKESNWKVLNGLTHTGADQVLRRNTEEYIESNFKDEEIEVIGRFVNSVSLLAGIEIVNLAKARTDTKKLESEFLEKVKEYGAMP